ncbi:protein ECERIFERUM 1-like isoform X1 [Iris pallida]|uniref:aldehyde oxygenase (deformylating) n=1 Tax=Iris pallida TaxID=29817 RepID=A0AAX6E3M1_IRIPA|nr:protein ECERIFERUM 1-like isoform X1 [Iris pallida]
MASQPGPLTHWPWHKLGNFKYVLLAPWVARSMYKTIWGDGQDGNLHLTVFPVLLLRLAYTQLWISLSRYQTAKTKHKIVNKSLDFDQVDRERNWDDQILLTALLVYLGDVALPGVSRLPWWETRGVVLVALLHAGPVEFLYYWLHRALHHHFLYSRYHSHHHASIVTEPITSVIHPFGEEMAYFLLFAIPLVSVAVSGTGSIASLVGYLVYIDFMNYLGHCNFELVPKWLFDAFPPLKYIMYTPTFHSLHHTQFRTNYSLFMPLYDYIYGTMDKSTGELYETCLKGKEEEAPDAVHLTHLTTPESIYHLRLGFASLSSRPYESKWYILLLSPFTFASVLLTWVYGATFTVERSRIKKLNAETWAIPRYTFQYKSPSHREEIKDLIEKAILEAEERGAKVMSFGLMNQRDELNQFGELYRKNNLKLRIKLVDGTSLAAAVVLHTLPPGTKEALLVGKLSKLSYVLALALCQKSIQVLVPRREVYDTLKLKFPRELQDYVVFSKDYSCEVWLVGDGLSDQEQRKAAKGVQFIPFSQFPPKPLRKDCYYHTTPALMAPKAYENLHACENWLPRKVMSAWRVAGIVHALEGWDSHECGDVVTDMKKVWRASLDHGFHPWNNKHV